MLCSKQFPYDMCDAGNFCGTRMEICLVNNLEISHVVMHYVMRLKKSLIGICGSYIDSFLHTGEENS